MIGLPPLSLYAHFPWCVAKCPYCDFNSHSLRDELPASEYIDALITDLQQFAHEVEGRPVISVFFGGGTPSLFPAAELDRLMTAIRKHVSLANDAEITLEANPGAIEHAAFTDFRKAGINRLSLGVQSLDDNKLKVLGRIHSAADAANAFAEARSAGFSNINLDLMYALPDQSVSEALQDISAVIDMRPEHVSHYHLTLEPNTVFYANPPPLPDDDLAWEIHAACATKLKNSGYDNYEVSAWGRPGHECRHNLNYWHFGDYIGIGAGAHGKLTLGEQIFRTTRPAHPREYLRHMKKPENSGQGQVVQPVDARFEFMLNNLRLRGGFLIEDFESLTGQSRTALEPALSSAIQRGMLEFSDGERIRPTAQGWRFLDDLQGIFLP
ncbi:MAG: radical SAM family heme chaperone HemW [Gammaproteobacteria bacterium]